jgi:hypothetical protein
MSAILRAADSRSKDCGNDGFYFVINFLVVIPEISLRSNIHLGKASRNYPGSMACANAGFYLVINYLVVIPEISLRSNIHLGKVSRNYPGSMACANASNVTRYRFPLKRLRE